MVWTNPFEAETLIVSYWLVEVAIIEFYVTMRSIIGSIEMYVLVIRNSVSYLQ